MINGVFLFWRREPASEDDSCKSPELLIESIIRLGAEMGSKDWWAKKWNGKRFKKYSTPMEVHLKDKELNGSLHSTDHHTSFNYQVSWIVISTIIIIHNQTGSLQPSYAKRSHRWCAWTEIIEALQWLSVNLVTSWHKNNILWGDAVDAGGRQATGGRKQRRMTPCVNKILQHKVVIGLRILVFARSVSIRSDQPLSRSIGCSWRRKLLR